mmetsp:Transcript_26458/g.74022  ORF Transcript_26458/g.74022 Transcript_26458/m.74022 type:complete len:215 (-) Transcript_26458:6517-7161(-)
MSSMSALADDGTCAAPPRALVARRYKRAQNHVSLRGLDACPTLRHFAGLVRFVFDENPPGEDVVFVRNRALDDTDEAARRQACERVGVHRLGLSKLTSHVPNDGVRVQQLMQVGAVVGRSHRFVARTHLRYSRPLHMPKVTEGSIVLPVRVVASADDAQIHLFVTFRLSFQRIVRGVHRRDECGLLLSHHLEHPLLRRLSSLLVLHIGRRRLVG